MEPLIYKKGFIEIVVYIINILVREHSHKINNKFCRLYLEESYKITKSKRNLVNMRDENCFHLDT